MATDRLVLGLVLAAELIFATLYAFLTRYLARRGPSGQTVWTVSVGVGGVVVIAGFLIGWNNAALLLACFTAAGLPMAVEYIDRVAREQQEARKVMEKALDGHASADRED